MVEGTSQFEDRNKYVVLIVKLLDTVTVELLDDRGLHLFEINKYIFRFLNSENVSA